MPALFGKVAIILSLRDGGTGFVGFVASFPGEEGEYHGLVMIGLTQVCGFKHR